MRHMAVYIALILAICWTAEADTSAVCWPQDSGLKGKAFYVCDLTAPPGTALTGSQLMAALAELEPVPAAFAIEAGESANRGGVRRAFARFEKYGLPIIAGLAAGDVFKVANWATVVLATLPSTVPNIREWVGAAVPPDWEAPAQLLPNSDIAFDSHGNASVVLYARLDGGVRRLTIPQATALAPRSGFYAPTLTPPPAFKPASWYALYQETLPDIERLRQAEIAWRKEAAIQDAAQGMNFAEVETLLAYSKETQ